jgi:hypothetical protein
MVEVLLLLVALSLVSLIEVNQHRYENNEGAVIIMIIVLIEKGPVVKCHITVVYADVAPSHL